MKERNYAEASRVGQFSGGESFPCISGYLGEAMLHVGQFCGAIHRKDRLRIDDKISDESDENL
ncbi:9166_t:CDS:2 [Funneliformis caledonium]|uniref:9166_t:CDS:1 n=1 Tax=Funneliformis caledonium TaxID=1117310 RepID=A0A9N8VVH2_9GLOM|nr:9166_t:CDS:2 [Funneliformis caledonium]